MDEPKRERWGEPADQLSREENSDKMLEPTHELTKALEERDAKNSGRIVKLLKQRFGAHMQVGAASSRKRARHIAGIWGSRGNFQKHFSSR